MYFNINSDATIAHAVRLEKLSRTAMPNVVRQTLNKAALDVKQTTMPAAAKSTFIERKSNFLKANSVVEFATGGSINSMKSTIGFKGSQQAIEDLEQQEHGGTIKGRSFIPIKTARVGNSNTKMVRANARLKSLKFVDSKNAKGNSDSQKFVKSVHYAGVGGIVLGNQSGHEILWKVNSLKRTPQGNLKLTPLYTFEKGRDVSIKETGFMEKASYKSSLKMEEIFNKEAEKRIQREFK